MCAVLGGSAYLAFGLPFLLWYSCIILRERYLESLYYLDPSEWLSPQNDWGTVQTGLWILLVSLALLGAAALRDIGYHFPPSDDRYKDIDSGVLVQRVATLVADAGWMPANVDVTIMAEQPRIKPYVEAMRTRIAELLGGETVVSVKATTCEGLGFVGREEGIAAMASVLLYRKKD